MTNLFKITLILITLINIFFMPTSIYSEEIDLNKFDVYYKLGWQKNYPGDFSDTNSISAWKLVKAKKTGNRDLKTMNLQLGGVEKRDFMDWSDHPAKIITFKTFFKISNTANQINAASPWAIFLSSIGHNWQIFINGTRIKSSQHPLKNNRITISRFIRDDLISFNSGILKTGLNSITYKITGDPSQIRNGFFRVSPYIIGPFEELKKYKDETISLILIALYLFVGLYHLLIYARRPIEKFNLYFALFAMLLFTYMLSRSNTIFDLVTNYTTIAKIELISLFILSSIFIIFLDGLFREATSKLSKYYFYFCLLLSLTILPAPLGVQEDILRIWQLSALVILFYSTYIVSSSFRHQLRNKKKEYADHSFLKRNINALKYVLLWSLPGNLIIGLFVLVFSTIFDVLDSVIFNTGIGLSKYGFFIFITGIAVSLANQFLTVHQEVEELNTNLEKKVNERTQQLQDTLNDVNKLKEQQDGDYFLTSLLLKPLAVNRTKSKTVNVEFIMQQKKKFQFRKWDTEIGGDINIAHNLTLQGKSYTVFINADAMGKSIQGAGGALVLGVVFNSVITRTQASTQEQSKSPEKWLKTCYEELQDIFVAFDGSMLISVVIGMIDDSTGLFYYINAEHPWTILFRDNKAEFIENELEIHKIGSTLGEINIRIKIFQLRTGDAIVLGSDGRDDILYKIDSDGNRVINEDETLILTRLEEAKGDLKETHIKILGTGTLTDDFTLLKVTYNGAEMPFADEKSLPADFIESRNLARSFLKDNKEEINAALNKFEALIKIAFHLETVKEYIKLLKKTHLYEKAGQLCAKAIDEFPSDTELFYLNSLIYKHLKNYNKAADYGERFQLRIYDNFKNIINLSDIYRLLKNPQRSKKYLDLAIKISPDSEQVKKLSEIIL